MRVLRIPFIHPRDVERMASLQHWNVIATLLATKGYGNNSHASRSVEVALAWVSSIGSLVESTIILTYCAFALMKCDAYKHLCSSSRSFTAHCNVLLIMLGLGTCRPSYRLSSMSSLISCPSFSSSLPHLEPLSDPLELRPSSHPHSRPLSASIYRRRFLLVHSDLPTLPVTLPSLFQDAQGSLLIFRPRPLCLSHTVSTCQIRDRMSLV
jgi:hypothetical protein